MTDVQKAGTATRPERERFDRFAWPDLDRFFERAAGRIGPWLPARRWRRPWLADEWFPDVDVLEREGKLVVRADLPGVKREEIEVKLEGDALVISGHREETEEVKEKDYYRCERQTGEFTRTITLPKGVDTANIEAVYDNGVLEMTVPKPAELAPKTVPVQVK